ncbi:hypothetical protein HWV62_28376 [Athelia sp. TMB]|nr:hypothetical protein HWV62_28376 [Athelia sp. TMB]
MHGSDSLTFSPPVTLKESQQPSGMGPARVRHRAPDPILIVEKQQVLKVIVQSITVAIPCLLTTPNKQKRYRHIVRDASRRSLSLARTNRGAILAQKKLAIIQIEQAEEYIGLLRRQCVLLDLEMADADNGTVGVMSNMNREFISECSLSDDEDENDYPSYPIPSSDPSSDLTKDDSGPSLSSGSDIYLHYDSDTDQSVGDEVEVAGEWASDVNADGGIGRLPRDDMVSLLSTSPITMSGPAKNKPVRSNQTAARNAKKVVNIAAADALPEPGTFAGMSYGHMGDPNTAGAQFTGQPPPESAPWSPVYPPWTEPWTGPSLSSAPGVEQYGYDGTSSSAPGAEQYGYGGPSSSSAPGAEQYGYGGISSSSAPGVEQYGYGATSSSSAPGLGQYGYGGTSSFSAPGTEQHSYGDNVPSNYSSSRADPYPPPLPDNYPLPTQAHLDPHNFAPAPTFLPAYTQYTDTSPAVISSATAPTQTHSSRSQASKPPQLDAAAVAKLSQLMYANHDAIEVRTGAHGDVVAEHRARNQIRMPNPLTMRSTSQIQRTVSAANVSVASASDSIFSGTRTTDSHFHPYAKKPTTKLKGHDKENVRNAGNSFTAKLCLYDCWMNACAIRRSWARESLLLTNSTAVAKSLPETPETDDIVSTIEHHGTSFRSKAKALVILKVEVWHLSPPFDAILGPGGKEEYIADRVRTLLYQDSFCNYGFETRTEETDGAIFADHEGDRFLFTHPAFLELVNTILYGTAGIARKEPINFLQSNCPLSPICMIAGMIKGVLLDWATGYDMTARTRGDGRSTYREYYDYFTDICTEIQDSTDGWYKLVLSDATRQIAETGKMTVRRGKGSSNIQASQLGIPAYINIQRPNAAVPAERLEFPTYINIQRPNAAGPSGRPE